ncbi:MAG: hypothetical protein V1725_05280 [archaeon]
MALPHLLSKWFGRQLEYTYSGSDVAPDTHLQKKIDILLNNMTRARLERYSLYWFDQKRRKHLASLIKDLKETKTLRLSAKDAEAVAKLEEFLKAVFNAWEGDKRYMDWLHATLSSQPKTTELVNESIDNVLYILTSMKERIPGMSSDAFKEELLRRGVTESFFRYNTVLWQFLQEHQQDTLRLCEADYMKVKGTQGLFDLGLQHLQNAGMLLSGTWPSLVDGMVKMSNAAKEQTQDVFVFGFYALRKAGLLTWENWPLLVQVAEVVKNDICDTYRFSLCNCQRIIYAGKWPDIMERIRKNPHLFVLSTKSCSINSIDKLDTLMTVAQQYYDLLGSSEYTDKLVGENADRLASQEVIFNRLQFNKTGSVLIPLGGKLTGYIIRIVSRDAYVAWELAEHALTDKDGVLHCEEILRDGQGNPRIVHSKDGRYVKVLTKFAGQALRSYRPQSAEEEAEIDRQQQWITSQLRRQRIAHNHPHDGNFTVMKEKNHEGMSRLVVKIIDFDLARSGAKETW